MKDRSLLPLAVISLLTLTSCPQITPSRTRQVLPEEGITLTVTAGPGGSVSVSPEQEEYQIGDVVTLTATPVSGSVFSGWGGDLSGTDNPATLTMDASKTVSADFGTRSWTIMVYMCGDNDLEAAMLADINEMEAAAASDNREVIVLADRAPGYDSSEGDWTDTRLFRIQRDPDGLNSAIVSQRLASSLLGLQTSTNSELDMSASITLSRFIDTAKAAYPAQNYALILWGHGTGWRSAGTAGGRGGWKGTIVDDTSADVLHTKELGDAIAGKGISLIGMDLCFGALLEAAYQIQNDAQYLVASEDAIPSTGWDYRDTLNRFGSAGAQTAAALSDSIIDSYAAQYASYTGTTLSCVDLSAINGLNAALNAFCENLAPQISTSTIRDEIYGTLVNDSEDFYFNAGPCDLFIDIGDMARAISEATNYSDSEASALTAALDSAVYRSWHCATGNARAQGLALHLAPLDNNLNIMTLHDGAYFKNAVVTDPLDFVRDSSWVPCTPTGNSLLDALWYKSY